MLNKLLVQHSKPVLQELGDHIDQKGSIVTPERLRFDFSHSGPIDAVALGRIEGICRGQLLDALPVYSMDVSLAQARQINGALPPSGPIRLL